MSGKTTKSLIIILFVLAGAFLLGKSIASNSNQVTRNGNDRKKTVQKQEIKYKKLLIGDKPLIVEVADNDEIRAKGLSGRDKLADDAGMLFIFEKPAFYSFWMKDMKIPLDFIWIKGDKIVDIGENIPVPNTLKLEELVTYTPKSAVDKVLEVNAGKAGRIGAKTGDKITLTDNI